MPRLLTRKQKELLWIAAALGLVLLMGCIDDGPQVAKRKQDAYCARVAAGVHTNYEGIKCQGVKP
jgi:hypothetical protein